MIVLTLWISARIFAFIISDVNTNFIDIDCLQFFSDGGFAFFLG